MTASSRILAVYLLTQLIMLVFWFISFSGFSGLPLLKLGLRASAVCMFMSLMVSLVSWFIGLLVNWFSGILKSLANEPENRKT